MSKYNTFMTKKRVLLSWSSGKDAAWALHTLSRSAEYEVVALLTSINKEFDRVAMHAVRRELLEQQARSAALPLVIAPLPWPCTNEIYESVMEETLACARETYDFSHCAFGDLFLEDVRAYRVAQLDGTGITPIFPIWGIPTDLLARQMIDGGLRARLTCVDPKQLSNTFAGRDFDRALLEELPATADPCGERGEFHTFVFDGPMFNFPIHVSPGEIVQRDGFVFADQLPNPISAERGKQA